MRSHAHVTSKNKTVGEMDFSISQRFRFCSILSVQIKCYGIRGSNKPGKLSWITVYVICRCFLLCLYSRETYTAFAFCFCKATCFTGTTEKRSGCTCLVRRATAFVQASVIVGQETDLLPLLRTCENYSKASYVVVCCYRFELQIKQTFWYWL